MEYCPYGQLYDVLHDGKQLPACLLCDWAKQITSGMTYLHSHKIIHRDLKSPKYVDLSSVSLFVMAACQPCWPLAILFYCCSLDLLSSFFGRLISEVTWLIATKLCHMFDGDPDL